MQIENGQPRAQLERLQREHRELDEQIVGLENRRFLSSDEEFEIKRLKRLKLFKKDEIAVLSRRVTHA